MLLLSSSMSCISAFIPPRVVVVQVRVAILEGKHGRRNCRESVLRCMFDVGYATSLIHSYSAPLAATTTALAAHALAEHTSSRLGCAVGYRWQGDKA
jgi:hypothetical protein